MALGKPCIYFFVLFVPFHTFLAKKIGIYRKYFCLENGTTPTFLTFSLFNFVIRSARIQSDIGRPSRPPSDINAVDGMSACLCMSFGKVMRRGRRCAVLCGRCGIALEKWDGLLLESKLGAERAGVVRNSARGC